MAKNLDEFNHHNYKTLVDLEKVSGETRSPRVRIKFTPEKRELFLAALKTNGNITVSASQAKLNRNTVRYHLDHDEEFAAEVAEAIDESIDRMEEEVVRRGFRGVPKGVYYQGKKVDEELQYSDTLAIRTLEALRPEKWATRSNINFQGSVNVTSDAKEKLLNLLKINEKDIIEGEYLEE